MGLLVCTDLFFGAEFTQVYARTFGTLRGDTSKQDAAAQAGRVEDRATSDVPMPAAIPVSVHQQSSRGLVKLAAGGAVGVLFGAIVGVVSTIALVWKTIRKVVVPFK